MWTRCRGPVPADQADQADHPPLVPLSRRVLGPLSLAAVLVVTGCASIPAPAATRAPSAPVQEKGASAQNLLDTLVAAGLAGDEPAFDAGVSIRDASFADRARLLSANLSRLPLAGVRLRLQPERLTPAGDRAVLLGPDAWVQAATLTWRLTGESSPAEHRIWLTFVVEDGSARLAGTVDGPATPVAAQPVWWTGPVTAATRGAATVVVGAGQDAGAWAERASDAVSEVRHRLQGGAARGWSGAVVVEVPATRPDFEAVLGVPQGSYAAIAAVTLAEGPADAAVRVVVNPEVTRQLAPLGVAVVLTHEAVHVATRSAGSPAPRWLVEGLADEVALTAHPAAESAVAAPLLSRVRRDGAPWSLPTDAQLRTGADDLGVAYAEAWLGCRFIAQNFSDAALQRLYAAVDAGQPLDTAAPDVLGRSVPELTAGWRTDLERRTGG